MQELPGPGVACSRARPSRPSMPGHSLPPSIPPRILQDVQILPTNGPRPVVYAHYTSPDPDARTVLIYGHCACCRSVG